MHSVVPDGFTVVKHKVDARIFQSRNMFPRRALIILEDEFLARVLSVPPNCLKMFNVFECHVCQETEILMNEPSEWSPITKQRNSTVALPLEQLD